MKFSKSTIKVLSSLFFLAISLQSFEANAAVDKKEDAVENEVRTRRERRVVNEVWPRVRRERRVVNEVWPRVRREDDRTRRPREPRQSIPLDGGLSILVLGAAAFGVKKLRRKN
jgi:hypothetical protein